MSNLPKPKASMTGAIVLGKRADVVRDVGGYLYIFRLSGKTLSRTTPQPRVFGRSPLLPGGPLFIGLKIQDDHKLERTQVSFSSSLLLLTHQSRSNSGSHLCPS